MSDLALRATAPRPWRRFADTGRELLRGIAEGVAAARRYDRLAATSDAELAKAGITREDVAWYALCGERRSR